MIRKRSQSWSHAPLRLALACVACAAACSGSNGGNGGNGIALAAYEAEFRAALCHYLVLCERMPDHATCVASMTVDESVSFFPTMQVDVAAGRVAFDAQAARACIDGFNSLGSCTQLELAPLFERLQGTCAAVFSGTLPPGDVCFFDEECAGRDVCSRSNCPLETCCQGTCFATPPPIPAGGDCTQMPQGWSCAAGTECGTDPQTQARICMPFLPPAATCGASLAGSCPDPYICRFAPPGDQMVCTPPVERGQTCNDAGDTFRCNDLRDTCDPGSNICVASVPVGGACPVGGCVGYADCAGSICIARGRPGDGCGTVGECLGDLVCDATTLRCTLPPPGPSCR